MNGIKITGKIPLNGEVRIQGSKNAALPMMAAALLNKGTTVLHGCPRISDVCLMEKILQKLGAKTCWQNHTLTICAEKLGKPEADKDLGEKMRCTIVLLGSLLGRCKEAAVPYPGGCVIGERPIDLHLQALRQMGAVFLEKDGMLYGQTQGLNGAVVRFPKMSVGATQNAVLGAVCAEGITVLKGCAREPEVSWLCRFLNCAGARIQGVGTGELRIRGVRQLHDVEFTVPPDRIAAGTYVCASAVTRGGGVLHNAPVGEMGALLWAYKKIGGQYTCSGGKLTLCSFGADRPISHLKTRVYPGFPTDMQSVFMAVLAAARGESRITETIFEDRFKTVSQLNKMGADIVVCQNTARIRGQSLTGAVVKAEELRGGAALVVAGLGAQGETFVEDSGFIARGYEDICRDLTMLGAQIYKE